MRIIGGQYGGRRFTPPANKWKTRPTTDYAKEALYNILQNRIDFSEVSMLDLFGGLGNHAIECISRGCEDATYVEKYGPCVKFVKDTAAQLNIEEHINIIRQDVLKFLKVPSQSYDFIFADPPYAAKFMNDLPSLILDNNWLSQEGVLVIEHDQNTDFKSHKAFTESRQYGGCHFSFFGQ